MNAIAKYRVWISFYGPVGTFDHLADAVSALKANIYTPDDFGFIKDCLYHEDTYRTSYGYHSATIDMV